MGGILRVRQEARRHTSCSSGSIRGSWLGRIRRLAQHWHGRYTLASIHKSFKEARAYVHGLGLKFETQWRAYCKSGKKPADIPAVPRHVYLNDGWAGWGDWLGNGNVAPGQHRSFKAASEFGNFNAPDPAFSGKLSQA